MNLPVDPGREVLEGGMSSGYTHTHIYTDSQVHVHLHTHTHTHTQTLFSTHKRVQTNK